MMHDQNSDTTPTPKTLTKRKGDKIDTGKVIKKSKHCRASKAKWSPEEDDILSRAVMVSGEGNWKKIAQALTDRSHLQCLHRWQKVLNPALVKGPWKEEEDAKLSELVEKYGPKDWSTIASHIPGRIGKQCRERWFNHLSPEVRKTNWTPEEDRIIIEAHSKIGNKWTNISKLLDGRPANAIKNHWNSTLLKRIQQDNSGESVPRRDRTRTKKPLPLRATEFDYRTHFQAEDTASECSPSQYSISPSSSPEMPYQEPPRPNTVRFQYPVHETNAQAFFNSFNEHSANVPASNSYTNAAWESWPAPNVIHLTPSVVPVTTNINHNLLQSHILGHNINSFNHISAPHGMEYGLGIIDPPTDELAELYTSTQHGTALPVELQYCFDHSQAGSPIGSGVTLPENYAPLSLESTGNVNMNANMNMGLLNLDLPTFCSLDM